MASDATECTPLLGGSQQTHHSTGSSSPGAKDRQLLPDAQESHGYELWNLILRLRKLFKVHVEKRILFAGFLITLSFSFTQVP